MYTRLSEGLTEMAPAEVQVTMGRSSRSEPGVTNTVRNIFVHDCFRLPKGTDRTSMRNQRFDVALLQLEEPYETGATIETIDLDEALDDPAEAPEEVVRKWVGKEATFAGWGLVEPLRAIDGRTFARDLRHGRGRVVSRESLAEKLLGETRQNVSEFLTGRDYDEWKHQVVGDHVSACYDDEGGPLFVGNVLIGSMQSVIREPVFKDGKVVARLSCGKDFYPQRYVRIDIHRKWMDKVMEEGKERAKDDSLCYLVDHD